MEWLVSTAFESASGFYTHHITSSAPSTEYRTKRTEKGNYARSNSIPFLEIFHFRPDTHDFTRDIRAEHHGPVLDVEARVLDFPVDGVDCYGAVADYEVVCFGLGHWGGSYAEGGSGFVEVGCLVLCHFEDVVEFLVGLVWGVFGR